MKSYVFVSSYIMWRQSANYKLLCCLACLIIAVKITGIKLK